MFNPISSYYAESAERAVEALMATTDEREFLSPSQWAERTRHLPQQHSPMPGPFSFDDAPYWREVVDCFDPYSDVHFVAVKKGAQVGATVSVLENLIGYGIEYMKSTSMIFATVDQDVTKLRLEQFVMPMLEASGLSHLIQSNDFSGGAKRQGATSKKLEWLGGGTLYPFGAKSPGKMRSFPVPWLLRDEVSGWPITVGKDGDPMKLTETRTNSFAATRKILDLSTPLLAGTDIITQRFKMGDQRYYEVPCKHCGEFQRLYFRGNRNNGQGRLMWETDGGILVPDSVRYVCPHCGGEMINEDKVTIMSEGKWVPTARPVRRDFRSYHLSAMYAPYYARSWEEIAQAWLEAWDDENNQSLDLAKLQVFYNNDLGEEYELKSDRVKFRQVSAHRRKDYLLGQVPNEHARQFAGGNIEVITMAIDVQHTWLAVATVGWAPSADNYGYAPYIIDYERIDGDATNVDGEAWQKLTDIIDNRTYVEGGREYEIARVGIDASELTDVVYEYCNQWGENVVPIRGRDTPLKGALIQQFSYKANEKGVEYLSVTVDMYKDRWSAALRRQWDGQSAQPRGLLNAPADIEDKYLKELTVEYKREERDPSTNKVIKRVWHRPGGSRNELWDALIYNTAIFESMVLQACTDICGLEDLVWGEFWAIAPNDPRVGAQGGLCWNLAPNSTTV
ncbi:terminase large subunit [Vibrio phage 1.009.O._10N.261.51.C9]|nr:terminase large subunit [Vibrio phage 1.009.O._10N.261.51.C9]